MPSSITVDVSVQDNASRRLNPAYLIRPAIAEFWTELERIGMRWLQEEAPERTGLLKRSHVSSMDAASNPAWIRFTNNAPYAKYVRYGTRPHVILPRFARALFWARPPGPVMRVNHPGTRPNRWMDRVRERLNRESVRLGRSLIDGITTRWSRG